jgi:hypothetical protein
MKEGQTTTSRIKEMDSLHFANVLYWREGPEHSREATVKYRDRQHRLREITAAQRALVCEGHNCD